MRRLLGSLFFLLLFMLLTLNCENKLDGTDTNLPHVGEYVVFAWNDLGMHCLNPSYDQAVILPPYNTVWAQVVRRGTPPQNVTAGLTVEYRILNNSYSYGKRQYGQFWDNVKKIFGTDLQKDKGLNLHDPAVNNGLSGKMMAKNDHFVVEGMPVTPVDDAGVWNPYQIIEITVKDDQGRTVAQTQATVPVSDEINCAKCHGSNPFADILQRHDTMHGTQLQTQKPMLCASCHSSPVLGNMTPSVGFLSQVIHKSHAPRSAECYDCHPGGQTSCNRSKAHTYAGGNCISCHGDMNKVADTIISGARIPWVKEPKCVTCHTGVPQVDTGDTLYRNGMGHGALYCAACHGSPHAMVPSKAASDEYQAIQYQGRAKTMGSCGVCHSSSKGASGEIGDFPEQHGGSNPEKSTACNVCHVATPQDLAKWPHAYQWKSR